MQLNDSSVYVLHVHAEPVFTTTESTEITREEGNNLAVGETTDYWVTCAYDNDAQTWLTDVRPQFDVVGDALKVTDAGVKWVSGAPVNVLAIEGVQPGFATLSVKTGGEWLDYTFNVYHDYNPTGTLITSTALTGTTADTVPTTAEISVDLTTSTSTAVSTVVTEEASTESSATMTSSETLTDDSGAAVSSTSEESGSGDLPQTGNNNPAEMILAAAAMLLGAVGAAYVFGVKLRRREE